MVRRRSPVQIRTLAPEQKTLQWGVFVYILKQPLHKEVAVPFGLFARSLVAKPRTVPRICVRQLLHSRKQDRLSLKHVSGGRKRVADPLERAGLDSCAGLVAAVVVI